LFVSVLKVPPEIKIPFTEPPALLELNE
jgi:hypothetical protein